MPERESIWPGIQFKALKGVNMRAAKPQLNSGEADRMFNLFPNQTGSLSRIPGKETWRVREDMAGDPIEVLQVVQAFMGRDYIITQFGDSIALDTLDELRNRTTPYSLTPTPVVGVGNYALIGNVQSSGDNGGALNGADNTFQPCTINTVLTDEGGMIQAISGNSFVLGLGTYRISARIAFGMADTPPNVRCGLYSLSNGAFKTQIGTSNEILGTGGRGFQFSLDTRNQFIRIMGRFQVTAATETLAIMMAGATTGASYFWPLRAFAQGSPGTASQVTGKPENYSLINLIQE